jgi:predicted ATPase
MSIPVQFKHGEILQGTAPITLVGANGAGKSRLGAWLVGQFGYDRVSAQRSLSLASISMQTPEDAKTQKDQQIASWRTNVSDAAGDLQALITDLKSEDVQSATQYRQRGKDTAGNAGVPEETKLDVLVRLWGLVFPGRELDLSGYSPKARWVGQTRTTDYYSTATMSDGERSAFYHIARILQANAGAVVIDEPEIHFHPMLARRFWDLVESQRSDCRFIYITHDLNFALSRRGRVGIVRGPQEVDLLDEHAVIPSDLFESILGAASLSVVAERLVFCEGTAEKSVDVAIYGSWFRAPATAVVPVGGCETVRRTFATFGDSPIIRNANAVAIVERDYWPDSYLARLAAEGLHVLPTHEIEGLLASRCVAEAIARHLAINDFERRYSSFETKVRARYTGVSYNKVVLERSKREVDVRLLGLANKATPEVDSKGTRDNFIEAVNLTVAVPDVGKLYDAHEQVVSLALSGSAEDMLRVFPGKDLLNLLVGEIGITSERYIELIFEALGQPDVGGKVVLETLRIALVAALSPHLPPREA